MSAQHSAGEARDARWAQSLADGAAGTALLRLERGEDAREWLMAMVAEPVSAHPEEATLFDGAPAVAFTLAATRYHDALAVLDEQVETITRARLEAAHRRIDIEAVAAKREFDLIAGLTGFGAYLLRRYAQHGEDGLLKDVLIYLVRLTEPRTDGLPGWWAASGPTGPGRQWAGGHGNLGVSHGISGPLALLALAMRRTVTVPGHADAINRICRWLDRWQCGTGNAIWWPGAINRAEHESGVVRSAGPQRPSWCYGTPGLVRAQQLAGLAVGDVDRQSFAERVLAWCLSDEKQLAQIGDASICHGWAGVLHTAWRVGQYSEQVRACVPGLLDRLTEHLRRDPLPRDGMLVGDAGARLALRAAAIEATPSTQWDACLLLNE